MKIRLILLCTLSALLWSFAARAQETVDAAKITCNQFMFGRIADSRTISIWLIGYYAGVRNNNVIDVAAVKVIKTIQVGELPWGVAIAGQ